jgi:hypothetical protein
MMELGMYLSGRAPPSHAQGPQFGSQTQTLQLRQPGTPQGTGQPWLPWRRRMVHREVVSHPGLKNRQVIEPNTVREWCLPSPAAKHSSARSVGASFPGW